MKRKNNKGFTLVELLAVTIILIIIFLIAINAIGERTKKSKMDSVKASALSYFKAARALSETTTGENNPFFSNSYSVNQLKNLGLEVYGTKPKSGFIYFDNNEPICGCLKYGKYKIEYTNGNYSDATKGICSDDKMKCAQYYATTHVFEFEYTGYTQKFTVPDDATYKLEVWGAQGGNSHDPNVFGGYGGYSVGYIDLKKNDKLYINVGEQGQNVTTDVLSTSYNGGASCRTNAASRSCGNGGGATSVALKSGQLRNLTNNASDIVIVAGGGGGASTHDSDTTTSGGSGGGYIGSSGSSTRWGFGAGGTQIAGGARATTDANAQNGSFGLGGNGALNAGAGGGGGFYGGGGGHGGSGGGGSGYIGNSKLFNAAMYCYNCQESGETATKTISTECVEGTPTKNCAKKGNGYARITMYRTIESDDDYDD